jgi:hypothetical protein
MLLFLYMDDVITGLPNSLSSQPGSSISMPKTMQSSMKSISSTLPSVNNADGGWSTTSIITVILIIVILALLGLNIFNYLAKGTDLLGNILSRFTQKAPTTVKEIVKTSVTGTEFAADVAAGTVKDAGDVLSRELDLKRKDLWESRDTGVKKAIHKRHIPSINYFPEHEPKKQQYKPSKTHSKIQDGHKKGYCYVGTDRGYRSCIKIGRSDNCESGKIFPTMDICINPSLRQ